MKHYLEKTETVFASLDSSRDGLEPEKAQANLETYGYNKLAEGKKKSLIARLLGQLADPMILILLAAAIVSGIVGEVADLIIIMTVVIINSVLGVVQEGVGAVTGDSPSDDEGSQPCTAANAIRNATRRNPPRPPRMAMERRR